MRDLEWAAFCALRFKELVEFVAIWDSWLANLLAILEMEMENESSANNVVHYSKRFSLDWLFVNARPIVGILELFFAWSPLKSSWCHTRLKLVA
jgi:hypothetical protein